MPKKMKYQIRKDSGGVEEVEGILVNKIWGVDKRTIVYGKQVMKDGKVRPLSYTAYFITHIPTGSHLNFGACRTLTNAKLLLNEPEFFDEPLNCNSIAKAIERFGNKFDWNY